MTQAPIRIAIVSPVLAVRAGLAALIRTASSGVGPSGAFAEDAVLEVIYEGSSLSEAAGALDRADILLLTADVLWSDDLSVELSPYEENLALLLLARNLQDGQSLPDLPVRAWGVLGLETSAEELVTALRALHAGLLVGSRPLLEPLVTRLLRNNEELAGSQPDPLTDRESQVLQLLARGLANKQIAVVLGISEHTVKFHVSSIYTKLGATNRTEAVRLGVQRGLVLL